LNTNQYEVNENFNRYMIIYLITISIIFSICYSVNAYSLNYARPIQKFLPSNSTNTYIIGVKTLKMNTTLNNQTAALIKQILNTDCRDIESAGIQYGCKIEQIKILKLFGIQIDQNTFTPSNPVLPTPNRICYPYSNAYVQLPFNESNIVFYDDFKEFPINLTISRSENFTYSYSNGTNNTFWIMYNTTNYNFNGIRIYIKNNFNNSIYVNS